MKQGKIKTAYEITESLSDSNLSDSVLWALYKTRKALFPHYDFQLSRQREIFKKYEGQVDGSQLHFKDAETAQKFADEANALGDMEVELENYTKPVISLKDFPGITIHQIEALEDFIEFTQ